eukprot:1147965-Pelagomonas_calceolata.AAC.2
MGWSTPRCCACFCYSCMHQSPTKKYTAKNGSTDGKPASHYRNAGLGETQVARCPVTVKEH